VHYDAHELSDMPKPETNTRKIIARLEAEGWIGKGGSRHDLFVHPGRPEKLIPVPRHRELTPLTARSIARAAGWN
jgi:predicted RNA binding protein YcfA (HicA-like mRNA interferase family)